jgi:purine-binding chemotaxis protein CheW
MSMGPLDAGQLAAGRAPAPEHLPLLRQRAAALAREQGDGREGDRLRLVLFELAGNRYGIELACVLRVLTLRELTPLPGAAAPLFGVTHWRGDVLTLLDIRGLLGVTTDGLTDMGRILVLDGADRTFGIVVDGVRELADIPAAAVRPLAGGEDGAAESLVRGMTEEGVFIMDAERVLARFGRTRRRGDSG